MRGFEKYLSLHFCSYVLTTPTTGAVETSGENLATTNNKKGILGLFHAIKIFPLCSLKTHAEHGGESASDSSGNWGTLPS